VPVQAINITTSAEIAAPAVASYGEICILGQDAGGTAADETLVTCNNLAEVATQFGSGTDIYNAAVEAFAQGVSSIKAIRAKTTSVVGEVVTEGSEQTLTGIPAGSRLTGRVTPTAGAATFVGFKYDDPLTVPGTGEFVVNSKTGKVFFEGASTDTINYTVVDWESAIAKMIDDPTIDIVVLANSPANAAYYGDLDYVWSNYVDPYNVIFPIQTDPTESVADQVTGAGKYSSKNVVAVAHKDTGSDVAGGVAGVISKTQPWDKLMWKSIARVSMASYFTPSEVDSTLEANKVNAIISKVGSDVLSDGLTTFGGDYKFVDITRTQYYIEGLIDSALTALIKNARVPYTPTGAASVQSAIASALDVAVGVGALSGYTVQMPDFDSIPQADKSARKLQNILVTAYLAGHIQTISLSLSLQLT